MSEDRIEILIEAQNKASAAIKSVVDELKDVKKAASDAGTSTGLSKIAEDLKALEAQVKATAKAMGALTEQGGSKVSTSNIAESVRAQNEAYKDLAASVARQAKAYDDANKLRIAGNEAARASDKALADSIAVQAKSYDEVNKLRIAGNKEAWELDKQRASAMANQAKVEATTAKQVANEYAKINELRVKGNQAAWDQYSKDQAADQVAKVKETARAQVEAAKQAKQAQQEAAKQAKEAEKATQDHGSALGEVAGLVKKAFASYLVYEFLSSVKDATSAILNWMGNIETYGIAIAASLQVGGKYIDAVTGKALEGRAAFDVARQDATSVIESLQVANFQTVATLDQLIRMYQEALPIAMKKGFDKKMVEEFTLSVTQAASAMGVSLDMMAEEARSLLTGAINMRNSRVAVALGITPDDVRQNSASADQLFSFLMGKLQVYRTAGEALQDSWRGLWSNFKDIMMQAGGKALEPLFEGIKQQLRETIDSIVTLDKAAGKIIWNPEFLEGITAIRDAIKDAWYYAMLLKEIGGAGAGAVKAVGNSGVGQIAGALNPLGAMKAALSGNLPTIPGAIWDLISGKGWDNRLLKGVKGFSLGPLEEFGKDRTVSTAQFAARQAISQSGQGERGYVDTYIKKAAKEYGVDAEDLAGIIYAESNFRNITSKPDEKGKKAYGYMQLRESTAKGLGLELGDLMDPEKNIMGGAKYYKQLLDMFGGDREQAMIAYNKGPGFVQKYTAGEYSDESQTYKVYGKIQTAKDLEKNYAEGEAYYRKAATYSKEMGEGKYYGGRAGTSTFEPMVGMTEQNQKEWQEAYKKQIAKTAELHTQEIREADNVGKDLKQNLKNQLLSKEELKEQEAEIDKTTIEQKLAADKKYLASHEFFTEEMQNLKDKEGKGIYTSMDERNTAEDKALKEQAKIRQDIRDREIQLGTADSAITQRANEDARAKDLEASKEKLGIAQFEYDNLKKVNDLKLSLQQITPTEALESEYAARIKLLEAQKATIAIEQEQTNTGTKNAELGQRLAKINEELTDTERKKYELVLANLKTDQIKQKNTQDLIAAQIAYNKLIADPDKVESLEKEAAISQKLYEAHVAETMGLKGLAAAYRDIAKVMQESQNRGDFWGGITDGLDAVINSIGSVRSQYSRLVQGIGGDMKSSLSDAIYSGWKGDLNFDKERQVYDAGQRLANIEAQKEAIKLQQEQIRGNKNLSESEKETAQTALEAKLKQLEAEQQLAEAQKQAAENSKGAGEIWQGFLDTITKKTADFLADSIIQDFFSFLSGEVKGGKKGAGLFGGFLDWITGAKQKTAEGVTEIKGVLMNGMEDMTGTINAGGSGIVGAFGNIFSGLATVAKGWMETIYKYVVDYLAQLAKAIGSFGGFSFGGSGPDTGGGGIDNIPVDDWSGLYHKGGSVLRYHAGGLKRDEVPIIAQKGEYVLSKQDVDFVNKVKGGGTNINVNLGGASAGGGGKTTIVPLGVTVMVDNQSSALLQASAQARQAKDEQQYIIDVVMKNINSRGSLGGWR